MPAAARLDRVTPDDTTRRFGGWGLPWLADDFEALSPDLLDLLDGARRGRRGSR